MIERYIAEQFYCSHIQDWVPPCVEDCPMRDSKGYCIVSRKLDEPIYDPENVRKKGLPSQS